MKAVVLAAGRGSRMQPLTRDKPKPLVEVAGEPLLNHALDSVAGHADGYVVVVGYKGERIVDYLGDSYRGAPVKYVWQNEARGRADAVLRAEPIVDGPFLVVNGDNVFEPDLDPDFRGDGLDALLFVEEVSMEEARRTGVVRYEAGDLAGVVEKPSDPPSTTAVVGLYRFMPEVFSYCRGVTPDSRGERELTDAVDRMIHDGLDVGTRWLEGWRVNVNTPEDVRRAEALLNR